MTATDFSYKTLSIRTAALTLDYYLVPWDTAILRAPVAQIAELRIGEPNRAQRDYSEFTDWCRREHIALCACRLPSDRIADAMFLEDNGFRFVELNYRPRLTQIQSLAYTGDDGIAIRPAERSDREQLETMAASIFEHGRFHQDPRIGKALGNERYRIWMHNAFASKHQSVVKCLVGGALAGFFVVEHPEPGHAFWSLVGLTSDMRGRGLGKRVWRTMLEHHRREGVHTVSTSISSHNLAAFNLYVSLGFRFPQPEITVHWHPAGTAA